MFVHDCCEPLESVSCCRESRRGEAVFHPCDYCVAPFLAKTNIRVPINNNPENNTGSEDSLQIGLLDEIPAISGRLAGVDEAGRGPLVGNVVAAAVILNPDSPIVGLNDSKKLTEKKREKLAVLIKQHALAWSVSSVSPAEIDELNILWASMKAMKLAVDGLGVHPDHAFIDGNRCPKDLRCHATAIVKGDARVAEISAASILAKVERDAQMLSLHQQFPHYGFDKHKGYPTKAHFAALDELGPCSEHRKSFGPVKKFFELE